MNKDVILFSKNNAEPDESNIQGNEDYSKRNTSERLELKFWNEMKKVHPRNERMLIYDQKIKNGLIYRGDGQDKEFKTNCMNEKNPDAIIYPDKNNLNTILKNSLKNDPLKKNPKKKKISKKMENFNRFSCSSNNCSSNSPLCYFFARKRRKIQK